MVINYAISMVVTCTVMFNSMPMCVKWMYSEQNERATLKHFISRLMTPEMLTLIIPTLGQVHNNMTKYLYTASLYTSSTRGQT